METITTPKITKKTILNLNKLLSHGLVSGLGKQEPGKMCVEAAVCCALGLEHGDNPPCVGSAVRSFKIALNDSKWSTNHARALDMKKLAIAQLGSDSLDQMEFGKTVFLRSTQKLLPFVFRKVAEDDQVKPEHKAEFLKYADSCEKVTTFEDARLACKAASASAYASAWFIKNLGDEFLRLTGELALEVLIEMKSPGCKWLDLADE